MISKTVRDDSMT